MTRVEIIRHFKPRTNEINLHSVRVHVKHNFTRTRTSIVLYILYLYFDMLVWWQDQRSVAARLPLFLLSSSWLPRTLPACSVQNSALTLILPSRLVKGVDAILDTLRRTRPTWQVVGYHGSMGLGARTASHQAFMKDEARIIVATLAYGLFPYNP